MKTSQRVVKNFLSLGVADVVVRLSSAALTIYIARYLGVEAFGQLAFASAFASYFVLFSTFGLPTLAIREIAKNRQSTNFLATNITALQLGLAVLATLLLTVSLFFIPLEKDLKLLTFLVGLSMVPNALGMGYVFEAREKMEFAALARVITQIIAVTLSFVLIYTTRNILVLPAQQFLTSLFGAIVILCLLKKYFAFALTKINIQLIKRLTKQAVPFVISALAIQLYYSLDSIILQFMKGSEVVGYYTAGYKIVLILIALAGFFQSAIYPTLSSILKDNRKKAISLVGHTSKLFIFLSLPLAMGGTILAPKIIELIYGLNYNPSILPFQIFIWSVFTIYANVSFGVTLLAGGRENKYTKTAVIGAALNLLFNLLLIPKFGLVGAAISRMVTEFYVVISLYRYALEVINVAVLKNLSQAFFAATVMGLILSRLDLSVILSVIIGAGLYFGVMIAFKFIVAEDVRSILFLFKKDNINEGGQR